MSATFTIDQPGGAGSGSPGQARRDLWLGHQVLLTAVDLSPGGYIWEFLPGGTPPGSTAVLADHTLQQASFTPDVAGSYRVRLIWNGGGPGKVSTKVIRVTKNSLGTLTKRGWGFPAFDERPDETNFSGNARGYAPEFEFILDDILENAFGGTLAAGGDLGGNYPVPVVARLDGAYIASSGLGLKAGTALQVLPGLTDLTDVTPIHDMLNDATLVTRKGANDAVIYQTNGVGPTAPSTAVASLKFPKSFNPNSAVATGGKVYAIGAPVDRFATTIAILKADIPSQAVEATGTVAIPNATKLTAEGSSGSLWAFDGSTNIYRIDTNTFAVTTVALPTAVSSHDMFEAGGFVYVTGASGKIWKVDPTTNTVSTGTVGGSTVFGGGGGAGFVWLTDGTNVYRVDATTLTVDSSLAFRGIVAKSVAYQPAVSSYPDYVYVLSNDGLTLETIINPTGAMAEDVSNVLPAPGTKMTVSGSKLTVVLPDRVASMTSSSGGTLPPDNIDAAGVADWAPIVPYVANGATLVGPATYTPTRDLPASPIPVILTDSTAATVVITLSSLEIGRTILVKDVSPTPLGTILDGDGDTIDGQPTRTISAPYESITLFRGPSEWSVI